MQKLYIILFIGICVLFVGCSTSDSAVAYQPQTIALTGPAFEMQTKVNALRQMEGISMLQGEAKLMEIAMGKAQQMYDGHTIDHSGFNDRVTESHAAYMGECLSYNYQAVSSEFTAWYDSKSHLKTLVNANYTHMGYAKVGQYGCLILAGYGNAKNKAIGNECRVENKGSIITVIEL